MLSRFEFIKGKIKEYIKFNIVGLANFAVSQGIYLVLHLIFKLNYIIAYTITSVFSSIASYFLNSKFTFKEKKYSKTKFSLSVLIYIFAYVLNMGIIIFFVDILHLNSVISPIIAPALSTPIVFFMMRKVIKHKKK